MLDPNLQPMSEAEFEELILKLERFGERDGDIGYSYWSRVIRELKMMRKTYLKSQIN